MKNSTWYGTKGDFERVWNGASSIDDVCAAFGMPTTSDAATVRHNRQAATKTAHALRSAGVSLKWFKGADGRHYNRKPKPVATPPSEWARDAWKDADAAHLDALRMDADPDIRRMVRSELARRKRAQ